MLSSASSARTRCGSTAAHPYPRVGNPPPCAPMPGPAPGPGAWALGPIRFFSVKILWFSWKDVRHPAAGGAERLGHEWRRRLAANGHTVRHVTARYQGSTETEIIDGVETIRRGRSSMLHYPAALTFHARHSTQWADCVIEEVNTVPYFVGAMGGRERVVLLYFQLARQIWFYQTPWPIAAAGYAAEALYTYAQGRRNVPFITISEDSRRDLAAFGVPRERVSIVRVGIDNSPAGDLRRGGQGDAVHRSVSRLASGHEAADRRGPRFSRLRGLGRTRPALGQRRRR